VFRDFFFSQETGGANQGNVGVGGVMDAPCPLPSLCEQKEIVRLVSESFMRIDAMYSEQTRAMALLDRIDDASLEKAFRGELLPPQASGQSVRLP
jgi:type I restriction enzyme S subunit